MSAWHNLSRNGEKENRLWTHIFLGRYDCSAVVKSLCKQGSLVTGLILGICSVLEDDK